ncbi:MAG: ATP-binding cassette domain-containing protein [Thermoleophilaceae bacterium]
MEGSLGERETVVAFEGGELTLGQANVNSVVLQGEGVSRFHATIVLSAGELELRDLDTKTGTRLDGRPIKRAVIDDGALIEIGQHRLRFDSSNFLSQNGKGALRLDAAGVAVRRDGKDILKPISLSISPGELVAVIGESGSGKTTLLRALAGVSRPSAGRVTLNGEPVTSRLTEVGYVPQDEIVHPLLTVDEALDYAAKLRLPGANDREVSSTVDRVLAELALEPHRRTRIGHLSGGQRKRVGVGSELLHRPSLLFLDEPTTGLDPALESQMMALFRYLARPAARGVVLVTHATQSLSLCDTLVVLARGGELCFRGSPADALEFFGVPSHDKIYAALEERPASEWRARLEERQGAAEPARRARRAGRAGARPEGAPQRRGPGRRAREPLPAALLPRPPQRLHALRPGAPDRARHRLSLSERGVQQGGLGQRHARSAARADPAALPARHHRDLVRPHLRFQRDREGARGGQSRGRGGREVERLSRVEGDRSLRRLRAADRGPRLLRVRPPAPRRAGVRLRGDHRAARALQLGGRGRRARGVRGRLDRGPGHQRDPAHADPAAPVRRGRGPARAHDGRGRCPVHGGLRPLGSRRHRHGSGHAGAREGGQAAGPGLRRLLLHRPAVAVHGDPRPLPGDLLRADRVPVERAPRDDLDGRGHESGDPA